jgi:hypothetical protein
VSDLLFGIWFALDLIQTRLGSEQQYKNAVDVARKLAATKGIRGIYQGLAPTILRNLPGNASYFFVYEYFKRMVCEILLLSIFISPFLSLSLSLSLSRCPSPSLSISLSSSSLTFRF